MCVGADTQSFFSDLNYKIITKLKKKLHNISLFLSLQKYIQRNTMIV